MKSLLNDLIKQWKQSIVISFRSSGKKHLILTGSKNSGKTTILNEILKEIDSSLLGGIITYVVRDDYYMPKEVILRDFNDPGIYAPIAIRNDQGTSLIPYTDTFNNLGSSILKRNISSGTKYIIIDEIGFLELEAKEYCNEIIQCFNNTIVMAVIRKELNAFTEQLINRDDVFIADLDEAAPY